MRTAVFDWDGTLAHIDDREFFCINHALKTSGVPVISKDFYIRNYYQRAYELGTGPRMVLEAAVESFQSHSVNMEKIYESYRTTFQDTVEKAELQSGGVELLEALQKQGFKIAVATMRFTHRVVQSELKHLQVSDFIDVLLTREDLGVDRPLDSFEEIVQQRVKLVNRALKELNSNIGTSFLVGDSWWDVRAGKAVGITTVLVRTGFSAYNDFSQEHPDYTVPSLKDFRDVLEKTGWNLRKIS